MVFLDPSLRTRTSFESGDVPARRPRHRARTGEGKLGAGNRARRRDGRRPRSSMSSRPHACSVDTPTPSAVRSFPRGSDWRSAREDASSEFARHCEKPVINLESARRHPCQELADALTLREKLGDTRGKKFVLSWAWHPKALPTAVPASAALAAARMGMRSRSRPRGMRSRSRRPGHDRDAGPEAGGSLMSTGTIEAAHRGRRRRVREVVGGAVALRAGPRQERACVRPAPGLAADRGAHADDARRQGHCDALPAGAPQRGNRRRRCSTDRIRSVVDEAENRLHAQRALLLTDGRGQAHGEH